MDINIILKEIDLEINNINSPESLEQFRLKYLGRKGIVAQLTASIPTLPQGQRASFGQQVNALKNKLSLSLEEKQKGNPTNNRQTESASFDIGMPGIVQELGHLHPLTQITEEICNIFNRMGFSIVEGPESESEYNNFTG